MVSSITHMVGIYIVEQYFNTIIKKKKIKSINPKLAMVSEKALCHLALTNETII
jgi:hypothetical protein